MDEWMELGRVMFSKAVQKEAEETEGFRGFCMLCINKHSKYECVDKLGDGSFHSEWLIPSYYCIGYTDRIMIETDRYGTNIKFPYEL